MSLERIRIVIGDAGATQLEAEAELFDDLCPETVSAILGALPITGIVSRWGDEIYFSTSVIAPEENQKELVALQALLTYLGVLSAMLPFLSGFPKAIGS